MKALTARLLLMDLVGIRDRVGMRMIHQVHVLFLVLIIVNVVLTVAQFHFLFQREIVKVLLLLFRDGTQRRVVRVTTRMRVVTDVTVMRVVRVVTATIRTRVRILSQRATAPRATPTTTAVVTTASPTLMFQHGIKRTQSGWRRSKVLEITTAVECAGTMRLQGRERGRVIGGIRGSRSAIGSASASGITRREGDLF
jgi:hypothetical protein